MQGSQQTLWKLFEKQRKASRATIKVSPMYLEPEQQCSEETLKIL